MPEYPQDAVLHTLRPSEEIEVRREKFFPGYLFGASVQLLVDPEILFLPALFISQDLGAGGDELPVPEKIDAVEADVEEEQEAQNKGPRDLPGVYCLKIFPAEPGQAIPPYPFHKNDQSENQKQR